MEPLRHMRERSNRAPSGPFPGSWRWGPVPSPRLRPVIATLVVLLPASTVLSAQQAVDSAASNRVSQDSAAGASEIQAIPASELVGRAEETSRALADMRRRLGLDAAVAEVASSLPGAAQAVDRLLEDPGMKDPGELSQARLSNLEGRWARRDAQLHTWMGVLERRARDLEEMRAQVERRRQVWEATGAAAVARDYPESLRQRTRSVLESVAELERMLDARLSSILMLQDQIGEQAMIVSNAIGTVRDAQALDQRQLLWRSSPPIWQGVVDQDREETIRTEVLQSLRDNVAGLSVLMEDYPDRVALHAALFLVLAVTFLLLRRRMLRLPPDENLRAPIHLLGFPLSVAFLMGLFLTRVVYPQAPTNTVMLALLLAVLPAVRLLPGLMHEGWRPGLYGLAVAYTLLYLSRLVGERTFLGRPLLLAVTAASLAGAIWLLRPGCVASTALSGRWRLWLRLFGRVAVVLLAISTGAIVLGLVPLGILLTGVVLISTVFAVVLLALVLTLRGVMALLLRSGTLRRLTVVRLHPEAILDRTMAILSLLAIVWWAVTALRIAGLFHPLWTWLSGVVSREWGFGQVSLSLAQVLVFVVAIWAAVLVSRLVRFVLEEDVMPRLGLPRGVPGAVSRLTHYAIMAVGFLFAVGAAGVDLTNFAILAGAFGVGIGFGLQDVINNFISGLILLFERPIKVDDMVELGPLVGRVRRIGIRSSTVRTFEGAEVIVPNGQLISSQVVNWTLSDRHRRVELVVGVAYGTDPTTVLELLKRVALDHPEILRDPEPFITFDGFGDSSLNFKMRVWVASFEDGWRVRSELAVAVNAALKEAGIQIPFPQRDLHVRSVDGSVSSSLMALKSGPGKRGSGPRKPES